MKALWASIYIFSEFHQNYILGNHAFTTITHHEYRKNRLRILLKEAAAGDVIYSKNEASEMATHSKEIPNACQQTDPKMNLIKWDAVNEAKLIRSEYLICKWKAQVKMRRCMQKRLTNSCCWCSSALESTRARHNSHLHN